LAGRCSAAENENGPARRGRTNPSHNFRILGHHPYPCQEQNALGGKIIIRGHRPRFSLDDARASTYLGASRLEKLAKTGRWTMNARAPEAHLLTAAQIAGSEEFALSHPLNPNSEVYLRRLGESIGLQRAIVTLARVPPGKESFAYHAHKGDEEWLFIVSGRGRAEIGDKTFEVGPGDFMAFPTPSIGHHLTNPYDADLVYLMGGERGRVDVGEFPRLGKHMIFAADGIYVVDSDQLERRSFEDWLPKK
jgi:uncharacterized cupin superfamily protein